MQNNPYSEKAPASFAKIENGQLHRMATERLPSKYLGDCPEGQEEASLKPHVEAYEKLVSEVNKVDQTIQEAQNKGSYLQKVLHLKETIPESDALGDLDALLDRLQVLEADLRYRIEENRRKNFAIKEAIIAELRTFATVPDWKQATNRVKELKENFIKTGPVIKEKEEEINQTFKALVDDFFQRRDEFYQEKKQLRQERLQRYQALTEKAESLQAKQTEPQPQKAQELFEEWKSVGGVNPQELDPLWQRFIKAKKSLEKGPKKPKGKSAKKSQPPAELVEAKKALLEEARQLDHLEPNQAAENAKDLQQRWKDQGPLKGSDYQSINQEFFGLIDRVFEKRYLENQARQRYKNLTAKPPEEQKKLKKQVLKELIKNNKHDLEVVNENLANIHSGQNNQGQNPLRAMAEKKVETLQRKLRIKNQILEELENENTTDSQSSS